MRVKEGNATRVLDKGYVELMEHWGSDERVVQRARMSTGGDLKTPEVDQRLVDYLWRMKHYSPFEAAGASILFYMPIFIARQFMRHRTFSISEASGRYTELETNYYLPATERIQLQDTDNRQGSSGQLNDEDSIHVVNCMSDEHRHASENYHGYLSLGVSKELARINLPLSTYAKFEATTNLRNWLHFLALRYENHAQYEIFVYAKEVHNILAKLYPWTMAAFEEWTLNGASLGRKQLDVLALAIEPEKLDAAAEQLGLSKRHLRELKEALL